MEEWEIEHYESQLEAEYENLREIEEEEFYAGHNATAIRKKEVLPIPKELQVPQPDDFLDDEDDDKLVIDESDGVHPTTPCSSLKKKRSLSPTQANKGVPSPKKRSCRRQLQWNDPPPGEHIQVTGCDGSKAYFGLRNELDQPARLASSLPGLLPTPISELKQQIESGCIIKLSSVAPSSNQMEDSSEDQVVPQKELWVERYRPRSYLDLLSDDGINRTLLHWLKMWDKAVFNRNVPKKRETKNPNHFKPSKFAPKFNEDLDEFNRPQHKVALLTGPPGLGKTTLAHMVARHAGYAVVELNASDDRSLEQFRTRLEGATQMRAVMGDDPRPNCLVIDEIDGAPAPSINYLVSMIKAVGGKKAKKKEASVLKRPVICICNDLYVPALKPLRQLALVLHFTPTQAARLASRLQEISRHQGLRADMGTLLALCEKSDSDIRSCLSTLQFVHGKKKELTMADVHTSTVGQKDHQKSLFSVWQAIFQLPQQKRRQGHLILDNLVHQPNAFIDNTSKTGRFQHILRMVSSCGEYDKLYMGLFDNYAHVPLKDAYMEAVNSGLDWLCFTDILTQEIQHSQIYALYPYLPFTAVAWHLLFARIAYPKLAYPRAHAESRQKSLQLSNLLTSLFAEMSPRIRVFLHQSSLVMDLLPSLCHILQPTFRPVNPQLFSPAEKSQLANLIGTMIELNLQYRQERAEDGRYSYVLDPNLEEICKFPGVGSPSSLTYATKQMIGREIELEKMRRQEAAIKATNPKEAKAATTKTEIVTTPKPLALPQTKAPTDFFGRPIKVDPSAAASQDESETKAQIWYHFKEGYSNAVRKTVRIQDLL